MAPTTDTLRENIGAIFEQAQFSLANHKKNCVALYKLHSKVACLTRPKKSGVVLSGEQEFGNVCIDMVNRVLVVKKGVVAADRIVRFIGSYVKFCNEKDAAEKAKSDNVDEEEETFVSRFTSRLLRWLLQGFLAKNKTTRYRCVHIISEMMSYLGELDEDTYEVLRESLLERICDKEPFIRALAVIALSKLIGSEDPDDVSTGEQSILEVLLDVLCYDPAAEVRRSALLNIPLVASTLDHVLSRTRDADPLLRKLVYSSVILANKIHPRQLSIFQREKIIRDGLGDREPAVRMAAGKLVTSWFDMLLAEPAGEEELGWIGDDGDLMYAFIRFLVLFDVVGPGESVAVDAVLSVFVTRSDLRDVFTFSDDYWKNLSPESVVLARVFIEDCINKDHQAVLEAASLPVVTAFAFYVQEAYNALLDVLQQYENARHTNYQDGADDPEELEEELARKEAIVGEMLRIATKLDYMDEIGRRKIFSVVRNMLGHPQLPPGLIERCLDILKEIMPSERDLVRVVVEIIIELRDGEDNQGGIAPNYDTQSDVTQATIKESSVLRQKQREMMTKEERMEADLIDIRCLMLCIAMLKRVNGDFEDNSTLQGVLADLIIPSVKRKELGIRQKSLLSLGLCCLIAKNMALNSFQLFLSQVQTAPEELKVDVLQIIFDILLVYVQEFLGRSEEISKRIIDFLLQTLETEESVSAQAVICTGLSKLLLSGVITDPRVLSALSLTYISPVTSDNHELRQCLSYFFPAYCYSSSDNQSRMQSIFMPTFDLMTKMYEERDEDQEMILPYQFGSLMISWIDPSQLVAINNDNAKRSKQSQVDVAIEILVALYDSDRSDDNQKMLCQFLGQIQIPGDLDRQSIHKLSILLSHHEDQRPFENSAISKIFERIKTRFFKQFEQELQNLDEHLYQDEEIQLIYNRIAVDIPEDGVDARVVSSSPVKDVTDHEQASEDDPSGLSSDESRPSSPTPPVTEKPRTRKSNTRGAKQPSRQQRSKSKNTPQLESQEEEEEEEESESSDTSNASTPEAEFAVPVIATPKKKGAKRMRHAPSPETPQRRRNRARRG